MIPLGDDQPRGHPPLFTSLLIGLNVLLFLLQLGLGPYAELFVYRWGVVGLAAEKPVWRKTVGENTNQRFSLTLKMTRR
jgi:hypothetical protein